MIFRPFRRTFRNMSGAFLELDPVDIPNYNSLTNVKRRVDADKEAHFAVMAFEAAEVGVVTCCCF